MAPLAVELGSLGADEAGGAGDENGGHVDVPAMSRGARIRGVRRMARTKLASKVWKPSAVSVTPGTTTRIVRA